MTRPIGPGTILADKYRIERMLGEGGMGVVFEATHLALQKPRAIKLLRPEIAASAEAARRFLREARAASALEGAHVACVHDVDRLPSGEPFLVMEYLEGADLASILAAHGALPVAEAALYLRQACAGLAEAHARGLVHRDIKPANLFLARQEAGPPLVKVLDFGVSKASAPMTGPSTAAGAFLGTLRYCAPEQIECASSVDARADLWALGVVLYELVTGVPPFDGASTAQLIAQVTVRAPAPPSERVAGLPEGLDQLILRCLEKDPARRFESAAELAEALAPFARGGELFAQDRLSTRVAPRVSEATLTAPPSPAPSPKPFDATSPAVIRGPARPGARRPGPVVVTALALLAGAGLLALRSKRSSEPLDPSVEPSVSASIAHPESVASPGASAAQPEQAPRVPAPLQVASALASAAPTASASIAATPTPPRAAPAKPAPTSKPAPAPTASASSHERFY